MHSPTLKKIVIDCLGAACARVAMLCFAVVAMCLLTGCSDNAEPEAPKKMVNAGLYVALGNEGSNYLASRATPAGDYEDGVGYENYFDLSGKDLMILFFSEDDKYLCSFAPTDIFPIGGTSLTKVYFVNGKIDASVLEGIKFKVMVLANWGKYPAPKQGDTIAKILNASSDANNANVYSISENMPDESAPIPLFGINTFEGVEFQADITTRIGTINMLRSMAKVTVKCASPQWTIASVSMTRYNTTGLKAPLGVTTEEDYVKGNWKDDYASGVSLPDGVTSGMDLPFHRSASGDEYVIYVPEYRNTDSDGKALSDMARIKVQFEDIFDYTNPELLRDFYLDFRHYGDGINKGKYFDIQRNYWYNYVVTKGDEGFVPKVDVIPYGSVDLRPGFGLE